MVCNHLHFRAKVCAEFASRLVRCESQRNFHEDLSRPKSAWGKEPKTGAPDELPNGSPQTGTPQIGYRLSTTMNAVKRSRYRKRQAFPLSDTESPATCGLRLRLAMHSAYGLAVQDAASVRSDLPKNFPRDNVSLL